MDSGSRTPGPPELRRRLSRFLRDYKTRWMQPLLTELRVLADGPIELWCLGGLPRDLVAHSKPKRPRDIDLVAGSDQLEPLLEQVQATVRRRTRFGGLQLSLRNWTVDVWPLSQTWAFREQLIPECSFEDLPRTTFLNIEAIAIELGSRTRGKSRRVADAGFFDALATRTIDINFEPNPFPALCVVRTLVFASQLNFAVSARLVQYLARQMKNTTVDQLIDVQLEHYGHVKLAPNKLEAWQQFVEDHDPGKPVYPPPHLAGPRQRLLFPE